MFPALWALDQGIVPDARRARVTQYLLANRKQAARVMTFYYLFKQMYAQQDAALDREVLDTLRAKWQGMAETGYRTSWEDFDGGSRAHVYGSFAGYFLSAFVLGVRPDGPVWDRRLLVEPRLGGLTSAEGTVVTEHGPVPVAWQVGAGRLDFTLTVPAGVTATVNVPRLGKEPRLTVNGRAVPARAQGHYLTLTLGAGEHRGVLAFVPLPPAPEPPPAPLTVRTSPVVGAAFESDVPPDSLIGRGRPTYLSTTEEKVTNDGGGTNADALRNGTTRNGTGGGETLNDGKTYRGYGDGDAVTFRLDTSRHPRGYDLREIATFAGHADSRASQNYSVFLAFTSDPARFVPLIPTASVACDGGSSEIIIRHRASGVAAVRFDFHNGSAADPGLGFNVYREICLLGSPTRGELTAPPYKPGAK